MPLGVEALDRGQEIVNVDERGSQVASVLDWHSTVKREAG